MHVGALCCNHNKVKGIPDYALPNNFEMLYTSNDQVAVNFRKDAQTHRNKMAMCSVAAKHGWCSRAHNTKMDLMVTAGCQLLQRAGLLLAGNVEKQMCVQTYLYGGDKTAKWQMMNTKKNILSEDRNNYMNTFKKLHNVVMEAVDKYISSFLGMKYYIETQLKDKCWDTQLSIHANALPSVLKHKGCLNTPTVNEIEKLMPSSDIITKNHNRQVNPCAYFWLLILHCYILHMPQFVQYFSRLFVALS